MDPRWHPWDALPGRTQTPHQWDLERAGAIVDAGGVDSVRVIWNDALSADDHPYRHAMGLRPAVRDR